MKKTPCLFLVTLIILTISCNSPVTTNTPLAQPTTDTLSNNCSQPLPTDLPMPKFLLSIYPSGSITKEEYEKTLASPIFNGIHITVSANGIDDSVLKSKDGEYRRKAILGRVQLFIDETLISNDTSTVFDELVDSGPFTFGWPEKLNDGFHKAKLIFNTDRGETISYEWAFCILP